MGDVDLDGLVRLLVGREVALLPDGSADRLVHAHELVLVLHVRLSLVEVAHHVAEVLYRRRLHLQHAPVLSKQRLHVLHLPVREPLPHQLLRYRPELRPHLLEHCYVFTQAYLERISFALLNSISVLSSKFNLDFRFVERTR